MKYKFVSALIIALLSQVSWGQSTAQYTHESKTLQKALSLYYQKQYKASSHFFRKELRRATTQAQKEQCSYYIASAGRARFARPRPELRRARERQRAKQQGRRRIPRLRDRKSVV